jgi:predicted Zn-dependent peptidase
LSDPNLFKQTLKNGLTLVAEAIPHSRAAAFQFLLPAGAVTDPDDRLGSATILYDLSYRGAGKRDIRELSDALDDLGLQRGGGAELEYTSFSGSLLADDLLEALGLYADILLEPHLPPEHLPSAQATALHRLKALDDQPSHKLFVHLQERYFSGGPHGRTAMGTEAGLRNLTPESIRADHARRYRPQGAILGVAGKFNWNALVETAERLFGDWTGSAPSLPPANGGGSGGYLHLPKETSQEQIGVAYPEARPSDPEFYNAVMAMQVLSGGFASRLFTEVREKRGLAYSVSAGARAVKESGFVTAYAGTTPERSQETLDVLLSELKRIAEGVTEDETRRARTGLLSSLVMQGESAGARVGSVTRDQFLRGRVRTLDEIRSEIEKVTPESIRKHLESYPPADFTVVTLGPTELEVSA